MATDLTPVVAALAELDDRELAALITATYGVSQIAPGLLAWIGSACDWEVNRLRAFEYGSRQSRSINLFFRRMTVTTTGRLNH